MAIDLQVSTSAIIRIGPFTSINDGVTPILGMVAPSSILTKNGVAANYILPTFTEIGSGLYTATLSTTDTNTTGRLILDIFNSGLFVPVFQEFRVLSANGFGALYGTNPSFGFPTIDSAGRTTLAPGSTVAITGNALSLADHTAIQNDINVGVSGIGYTSARATSLSNLDAAISTRSTFAGGAVASVTAPVSVSGAVPSVTAAVNINLAQTFTPTDNTETIGGALAAARAQGFGKWALVGTTLTLYAADGTTAVKTFTLDSATAPTTRS